MFFLVVACLAGTLSALDNGVGRTPAMGWNSWNRFACNINENMIRKQADALVSTGLAGLGYRYLNVDDCWQSRRDATRKIEPDPLTFPSGIKPLSDYIHSKNLLFGLYSSAGVATCQGRPGGLNHERVDARRYAEWEIDYFKYDNCFHEGLNTTVEETMGRYVALRDALNATHRRINYAICNWGQNQVWEWGGEVGNSWRTTLDISNNWKSVVSIIHQTQDLSRYAHPGGFNDLDMLEIGNHGLSHTESITHFSVWCFLKSPLLLGHDLTQARRGRDMEILGNVELIAVNQDALGKAAVLRVKVGHVWVWVGELKNGEMVVGVVNLGAKDVEVKWVGWQVLGNQGASVLARVRDLWEHRNWEVVQKGGMSVGKIPFHGCKVFRVACVDGRGRFAACPSLDGLGLMDGVGVVDVEEVFSWLGWWSEFERWEFFVLPLLGLTLAVAVLLRKWIRGKCFVIKKGGGKKLPL
ncbi:hypothetical protein HDU98_011138 [Podochytrium sp. JEL0797]|nr:hypothetical protein HDU98_011138 [Podochytrium sp. JEL0797]